MSTIENLKAEYSGKIDHLDLDLIISHILKKPREFVLAHPEARVAPNYELRIKNYANRRMRGEPLAYILGHKEFYGLDFKVDENTLIPRPETELLVEIVHNKLTTNNQQPTTIIDIGTGSGNIIISMAHNMRHGTWNNFKFYGIDISTKALQIAKQNAKTHKVDKKIKFICGNLLEPVIKSKIVNHKSKIIILANLPYLSREIYNSTPVSVKKYEPKSALYSSKAGLNHYEKLLQQIKKLQKSCSLFHVSCFMELSPEQKTPLNKLAKKHLPHAKIAFYKDLSGRWRIARIEA